MGQRHIPRPVPVVIVIGQLGIGGSERQLYLFLRECDRSRWEPRVLAGSAGPYADAIRALGIEVEILPRSRPARARAVRRCCASLGARTFVSWSSFTNPYAWSLTGLGVPAVGSYRNAGFADLPVRHRRLWAWLGLARLQAQVANSAETAAELRARGGRRVLMVPNAVERPSSVDALRVDWRERLGVAEGEVLVLGIGRLAPQKNFPRFIDTIAEAAARVPALRAGIIGPDYAGLRDGLAAYARAREPRPGTITFHGPVPAAAEAVCAADLLLLTSDHEGMPNVVLEAMAAGVPVVTTSVNGVGALLTDGSEGFVRPPDTGALAEAVACLAQDAPLRREMGARGRRRIADRFDPAVVYRPLWMALPVAPPVRRYRSALRALDVLLGGAALVAALPVLLLAALLVRLESSGPALHRATRVGRHGVRFEIFKLRSMRVPGPDAGPGITARDDPRITRVGRWLRRWKIDELPQLLNVLAGRMSLVGPRPEDPRYVDLTAGPQRTVLCVRPGMTSPASLKYRHEEDLHDGEDFERRYVERVLPDKLAIDAAFVESLTVRRYLLVLVRTAWSLLPRPQRRGRRQQGIEGWT